MPYIHIKTNTPLNEDQAGELAAKASDLAAKAMGKPEKYVLAMISPGQIMLHGGTPAPAAHVECRGIGLQEAQCAPLSETICSFLEKELSIAPDRVYIEFSDMPRAWVGWNKGTF